MVGRTVGDTEIQFAIFFVVFGGMGEELDTGLRLVVLSQPRGI